jgi:hypothetical protein
MLHNKELNYLTMEEDSKHWMQRCCTFKWWDAVLFPSTSMPLLQTRPVCYMGTYTSTTQLDLQRVGFHLFRNYNILVRDYHEIRGHIFNHPLCHVLGIYNGSGVSSIKSKIFARSPCRTPKFKHKRAYKNIFKSPVSVLRISCDGHVQSLKLATWS